MGVGSINEKSMRYKVSTDGGAVEVEGEVAFDHFGRRFMWRKEIDSTEHGSFECIEISEYLTGRRIPLQFPCSELKDAIKQSIEILNKQGIRHVSSSMLKHQLLNP